MATAPAKAGISACCLARTMLNTLAEEPTLEAVTIDRANKKISVATLGRTDIGKITARVSHEFESAQVDVAKNHCTLLDGKSYCTACEMPLTEAERKAVIIRTEGDATTIARVTCPTAPKFWRWRDLPFPKIVQRDVEFLDPTVRGVFHQRGADFGHVVLADVRAERHWIIGWRGRQHGEDVREWRGCGDVS